MKRALRWLRVTRRQVPLDRLDAYGAAWRSLERAAALAGARAWLFRRTGRDDSFIEFVEWGDAVRIDHGPVADASLALDAVAAGTAETCEEVRLGE